MSNKNRNDIQTLKQMEQRQLAAELIRRGMRPATVRGLVRGEIPDAELARIWKQFHHRDAPSGRPRNGTASVIDSTLDAAMASAMLVEYLSIARRPELDIDVIALCVAWDRFMQRIGWVGSAPVQSFATITTMWLIARDYVAHIVRLRECDVCHASHIRCDQWCTPKYLECPHCQLQIKRSQ